MNKKKVILLVSALFIVVIVFIFYKEGILFSTNSDEESADSLEQITDSLKDGIVPLGDPPAGEMNFDTIKQGNSDSETKPDGVVSPKDIKNDKPDTVKKTIPLGKPPADEKSKTNYDQGGSDSQTQEDKSK